MAGHEMRAQPGVEHAIPTAGILFRERGIELFPVIGGLLVTAPDVINEEIKATLLGGDGLEERDYLGIIAVVAGDGDTASG